MTIAIGGCVFWRSVKGGIGTIVMAISCAFISKRELKDETDSLLKRVALTISTGLVLLS